MSSAILYLAIVAIWAGVLIPRWLRHDASQERPFSEWQPYDPAAGYEDDLTADPAEATIEDGAAVEPPRAGSARRSPSSDSSPGSDRFLGSDRPPGSDRSPGLPGAPPGRAERRARVLAARRRLLAMLAVLVAGAAVIAAARLAAWWVVVPPSAMLAGYLGLLREASRADAERDRAEHAAAEHAAAVRAHSARLEARRAADVQAASEQATGTSEWAAGTSGQPPAVPRPAATAEVLDISADVDEEPYDQYADAELRAVGD